jgi:hypothetical protein
MVSCKQCVKFDHKKGDCWELETNKDILPNGYHIQGEQANVAIENADDEGIKFAMVAVHVLNKTVLQEYEVLKLEDAVLTEEYADVIVNDKALVNENETVPIVNQTERVKYEHKQCFEIDMLEVALVGMEFLDSMRLLSPQR